MSSTDQIQSLAHEDYPGLFQAADAASVQQQRNYLRTVRFRLALTVMAAVFGAFPLAGSSRIDAFAVCTALAFIGVMAFEMAEASNRPDRTWYESRALAESIKTLTWRYVTGAEPFPITSESTDDEFVDRVRGFQRDKPGVPLPSTGLTITKAMQALRAAPLAERKEAYVSGRVRDQQQWYANKALHHQRRARIFRSAMLVMEVVGISAALAKAFTLLDFDLAGIVAASISALAAWNSTHQHGTNATAYMTASHELTMARDQIGREPDEQQWSTAVVGVEAGISREHTMWRTHRST